jgi:hypothetical protein
MSFASWLKKYYSPNEIGALNPSVVLDGKNYAVVKLTVGSGKGTAKVAYIGVRKAGRNGVSEHTPLWEGPAYGAADKLFKDWLAKADAQ